MFSSANSNYPAGVTDAHEHFNPVESVMAVKCMEDETEVVPSHGLKEELARLVKSVGHLIESPTSVAAQALPPLQLSLQNLLAQVEELEDVGDFDCPFDGDVDVQITDNGCTAEWTCPTCGAGHSEDIGEDDDPDRARDEARDREYD